MESTPTHIFPLLVPFFNTGGDNFQAISDEANKLLRTFLPDSSSFFYLKIREIFGNLNLEKSWIFIDFRRRMNFSNDVGKYERKFSRIR